MVDFSGGKNISGRLSLTSSTTKTTGLLIKDKGVSHLKAKILEEKVQLMYFKAFPQVILPQMNKTRFF